MVPVGRGLLQGGVRDLHLFAGICRRLEKVGHEEDLQDTEEDEEEESSSHALFNRSYLSNHGDSDDFLLHFVVSNVRQTVPLFFLTLNETFCHFRKNLTKIRCFLGKFWLLPKETNSLSNAQI